MRQFRGPKGLGRPPGKTSGEAAPLGDSSGLAELLAVSAGAEYDSTGRGPGMFYLVGMPSPGKTVAEIRAMYGKYAEVDHTQTVSPADLDISKEGGEVVIAFAYEKRIPLFANVSLVIEFEGSSSGQE